MSELFDLDGRVAVVTGGGRGIGRAIAVELANAGAAVVPSARSRDEIESVAADIEDAGGDALAVPADVTDSDAVSDVIDSAVDEFGGIDIVVNNAGFNPDDALGRPETVEPESLDRVLDVNLNGAYEVTRAAADHLLASDGGSVINVASVGGLVGLPRQHPYVARSTDSSASPRACRWTGTRSQSQRRRTGLRLDGTHRGARGRRSSASIDHRSDPARAVRRPRGDRRPRRFPRERRRDLRDRLRTRGRRGVDGAVDPVRSPLTLRSTLIETSSRTDLVRSCSFTIKNHGDSCDSVGVFRTLSHRSGVPPLCATMTVTRPVRSPTVPPT